MKFNPTALKGLFGKLANSGVADDVAKLATNYGDDAAKALDTVDGIPNVTYIRPRNIGLSDDIFADTATRLGKYVDEPTFGVRNTKFHEISPDLNATVQVPELPLDDLVFAQQDSDPSIISVRPHKNTALGRWFQNQVKNINGVGNPNPVTYDEFVQNYKAKRLAEVAQNNRLNSLPQFYDEDLPF